MPDTRTEPEVIGLFRTGELLMQDIEKLGVTAMEIRLQGLELADSVMQWWDDHNDGQSIPEMVELAAKLKHGPSWREFL